MNAERPMFGRRRQHNEPGGRKIRHVVKVTPEEEAGLVARALEQQVTVSRLMVDRALAEDGAFTLNERRQLAAEISEVRRLLANGTNNLNQLARYSNETRALPEWTDVVVEEYREIFVRATEAIQRVMEP